VSNSHLETEQKYEADPGFTLPDLGAAAAVAGTQRYLLHATYFDTDDLALNSRGVTLRRRTGGADAGWHLKLPVRTGTRQEVHAPLDEGTDEVPAELAAQVAQITAGRRLRPIATLDTERTMVTLAGPAGAVLAEVADDRVTATRLDRPGRQPTRWREIEVEAGSQDPAALSAAEQAGMLLRRAGARPSSEGSKLARLLGSG